MDQPGAESPLKIIEPNMRPLPPGPLPFPLHHRAEEIKFGRLFLEERLQNLLVEKDAGGIAGIGRIIAELQIVELSIVEEGVIKSDRPVVESQEVEAEPSPLGRRLRPLPVEFGPDFIFPDGGSGRPFPGHRFDLESLPEPIAEPVPLGKAVPGPPLDRYFSLLFELALPAP